MTPSLDPPREIELKYRFAPERTEALRAEIEAAGGTRTEHQAIYWDTPDAALAGNGLSLRLRKEGTRWVQTLKLATGGGMADRLEHEVPLQARAGREPRVDAARHDGTPAGQALQEALAAAEHPVLQVRHRTRVLRQACRLGTPEGAVVQVSMDEGSLQAGDATAPVLELEFELLDGPPGALAALCTAWVARHGLWLASETKAQRGERLRAGAPLPVVKARASTLRPGLRGPGLWQAVLRDCLAHILPNAAALAEGSTDEDHVHQMRVGLRRLRTAVRELAPLAEGADPAAWEPPLAQAFRQLGTVRDAQTVIASVAPRLAQAGAPQVPWHAGPGGGDLQAMARDPALQAALTTVQVQALPPAQAGSQPPGAGPARARRRIKKRLKALHRRVLADGRRFRKLPIDDQHGVRKRLKRLRYLAEFAQPLFRADEVEAYLALMRPAQDELGLHNDYAVARGLIDPPALARGDPAAARAAAWLDEQLQGTERRSAKALRKLDRAPRFWRHRPR